MAVGRTRPQAMVAGGVLMPLRSRMLDPRLYETLAMFYPSTTTIKARATADAATPTSFGEPSGSYVSVAGCEAIQCRLMRYKKGANERRVPDATITADVLVIDLAGYYPIIETRMIATVDAVDYDIQAVQHDAIHTQTQLRVEVVTT